MFPSAKDKDPSGMIEMDRFVTTLRGRSNEVIERHSVLSAATMRHHVTNDRYHITHIDSDSRQFFMWLLQASKRNNWKPKAVHHGDPGLRVTIQFVGAQVAYCLVDQRKQTRQCSRFLDPKVLKMEGRPFSWWRW